MCTRTYTCAFHYVYCSKPLTFHNGFMFFFASRNCFKLLCRFQAFYSPDRQQRMCNVLYMIKKGNGRQPDNICYLILIVVSKKIRGFAWSDAPRPCGFLARVSCLLDNADEIVSLDLACSLPEAHAEEKVYEALSVPTSLSGPFTCSFSPTFGFSRAAVSGWTEMAWRQGYRFNVFSQETVSPTTSAIVFPLAGDVRFSKDQGSSA